MKKTIPGCVESNRDELATVEAVIPKGPIAVLGLVRLLLASA